MMDDIYACALQGALGGYPRLLEDILSRSGSPGEAFTRMMDKVLSSYRTPVRDKADILQLSQISVCYTPCSFTSPCAVFIRRGTVPYPANLLECPGAPAGIFLRSNAPAARFFSRENFLLALSVPAKPSAYGKECLGAVMEVLSGIGRKTGRSVVLVGGLEEGCERDIQADALRERIPSVIVTGRADGTLPPGPCRGLCEHLSDSLSHGLLTDIPSFCDYEGDRRRSMERRDRLIAALCDAVLVIEASRGYETRLPRLAFDFGRSVFAFPGRVSDPKSEGANILIRDNIAQVLCSATELPTWVDSSLLLRRGRQEA